MDPVPSAPKDQPGAPDPFLVSVGEEIREAYTRNRRVMSFGQFFELVKRHPERHTRGAAQYLRDVFDYYGTTEVQTPRGPQTRFLLFDCPFDGGKDRLIGQEEVQGRVYRILSNFVRDGRVSKLILLHGPNGSAKSTFVSCLMRAMEHYSTLEEGALYRFNWIFPSQKLTRGGIGFGGGPSGPATTEDSYAHLDDDQIDVKLADETHDHPLLLLPLARRRQLLDELARNSRQPLIFPDYLYHGDLSPRNKQIFEALLQSYRGDFLRVLRHVQVERMYFSRRYRWGVVTVEPQMSVDASAQQITVDRSLTALPQALQALTMLSFHGELVDGNRGLIEYADLLKRPLEAYKYLLGTVEYGRVTVGGQLLYLDAVFIASSNELHLQAFKELPDFQSFKGRMELVRVPYLLDFTKEQAIYDEQIRESAIGRHVAPHATWVAALWGVLTRMRKPVSERYDKPLAELVNRLTPLDKAYLYARRQVPKDFTPEQAKELLSGLEQIWSESDSYPIYEGRTGISPRELKTLLLNAAQNPHYRCLSPFAVLEEIEELLKAVSVHEFLRQEPLPGGYHEHRKFVQQVRDELVAIIDEEVRSAMGLIDEDQYAGVFARYVNHVSHWVKKERLVNPITGETEEPDAKMMAEIERAIGVTAKPEEHRRDLMRRIAAWSIDHAAELGQRKGPQHLDYAEIFPEQFQRLRESYFAERKKQLKKINQDLLIYLSETSATEQAEGTPSMLDRESAERVRTTLRNLKERYRYNEDSARDAISFLLRRRYS
ncbi:MAG: serine protein kinase PrkA [Myxococcales bacterium]|nr:serine protein kinase PrkA [Myxococcota bacterium]MDW8282571.1 serine protein kinase PrkA [Myxococcales bacterium]